MSKRRKSLLVLVGAGGAVVLVASLAYACVTFAGSMQVCNSDGECISAFGEAEPSRHTIRAGQRSPVLTPANRALNSFDSGVGPTVAPGEMITIEVASTSANNKLPAGTYDVNFLDLTAYELPIAGFDSVEHHATRGCIVSGGAVRTIGSLIVDGHGSGSGTFSIPDDAMATTEGQAAVCVAMPQTIYANQAPVIVQSS